MEKDFIIEIQNLFSIDRIKTLLVCGSRVSILSNRNVSNLYLLLDQYEPTDEGRLRNLLGQFGASINLTYQYLSDIEARGWLNFQLGQNGLSCILNFANAKTLLGNNVFQCKIISIDCNKLKESLLAQIQEYFGKLDNLSLNFKYDFELAENYKKLLLEIILNILLYKEDISFLDTTNSCEEILQIVFDKNYFSNATKSRLKDIFFYEISLPILLSELKRFLYLDYLEFYK